MTEYVDVTKTFGEFRAQGLTPDMLRQIYATYLGNPPAAPDGVMLATPEPKVATSTEAVPTIVYTWAWDE